MPTCASTVAGRCGPAGSCLGRGWPQARRRPMVPSACRSTCTRYRIAPVYYVIGRSGVPGADNEGHTSNAGFVVTDAGVVVFDALGTPALGYRLLQRIREVTDQPIERIVISHYHADHIYGLQAFKDHAGDPPVWAQHQALGYAGAPPPARARTPSAGWRSGARRCFPGWTTTPTSCRRTTPSTDATFEVGGVTFELKHLGPAHAPGDSIMLVRDYGVLFSGDVIYKGRVPFLDSPQTDIDHWLQGLDYLSSLEPQPRFVIPGHGTSLGHCNRRLP